MRDGKSRKLVADLLAWRQRQSALPSSGFGRALTYLDGAWLKLYKFLDNPHIPVDTNGVERGMRGWALGRNNHSGSRSKRGTEVTAVLCNLVETCKLVGVDPRVYLREAALRALAEPGTATLAHALKAEIVGV